METIPKEEVFSIEDRESRLLFITSYRLERVHFPEYSDPAWDRVIPPRTFKALRIEISRENGLPGERHYWIDSKRLMYSLLRYLEKPGSMPRAYQIRKYGLPPNSQYTVTPR